MPSLDSRPQQIAHLRLLLHQPLPDSARQHIQAALTILAADSEPAPPQHTENHDLFQQAREAISGGRRDEGRRLLASFLREHTDYVPAWLWMSTLLDDPAQRRDCLQRVLALDPNNATARQQLEVLNIQSIISTVKLPPPLTKPAKSKRLGEYLVSQRFITQEQLTAALSEQEREARRGINIPLGDILVRRRMLHMNALWQALELQKADRKATEISIISRLGEQLIVQRLITKKQLEDVLARQLELRQKGNNLQLGELLVRMGALSRQQLEKVLEEQRQNFFSQLND